MKMREIRKELGLSQVEFARLLGVHQTAVSQWETGRTSPEVEIARRVARISGHTLSEVLDAENAPEVAGDGIIRLLMPDDGLRSARLRRGDVVYLRTQGEYLPYDIVAAETTAGTVVRRIVPVGGRLYLFSDDPRGAKIELTPEARVIGRVFAFYSELE